MSFKYIQFFFVTAPAWKVFSLLVLPMVLFVLFSQAGTSMVILQTLLLFGLWTALLWFYSIGVLIYEKYSNLLSVPITRFKGCLIYDFIYSVLFSFMIIPFEYLLPFHVISIACKLYAFYFISKLIVIVERRGEVRFRDYIGTFIAAWFFMIGIWFLQPRINAIMLSNDV